MVNWKYSFSIPFYYIIWLPSHNFQREFWILIIVDFSLQCFDYYSVKPYRSSFHTTTMWCVLMNSIKTMLSQNVYLIIILAFSVIGKNVSNNPVWLMLIFKQSDIYSRFYWNVCNICYYVFPQHISYILKYQKSKIST